MTDTDSIQCPHQLHSSQEVYIECGLELGHDGNHRNDLIRAQWRSGVATTTQNGIEWRDEWRLAD